LKYNKTKIKIFENKNDIKIAIISFKKLGLTKTVKPKLAQHVTSTEACHRHEL